MQNITIYQPPPRMTLDQSILAWLDEKRADSVRTATAYEETLNDFRDTLRGAGLDLDSEPALVAPLAQGWARASKREGVTVTPTTFNQRRSIVSSYYKYAITYEVLAYNPMERVKRQKLGKKDAAHHLASSTIKSGLARIDRSTPEGLRDYALLSIALATGRRASEIAGLRYKHLHRDGNTCVVDFDNCKGKKKGQAIGIRTLSNICEAYLGTSKFHAPRHSLAVTMHLKGAKITDISKALGHSDIKITSDYLEEHLSYENPLASELEEEWGI